MNKTEIKEFKMYVRQTLMKKYHLNELDAQRAVNESYLTTALERDNDYIAHDTVEEWADFIYEEENSKEYIQM